MIYICTWATRRATGTIEVDGRTVAEARKKAWRLLRNGYGVKARIARVEIYGGRRRRGKNESQMQ